MKLLILGGTKFLGRAFVEQALAAGHEVTLFNRGRTGPDLFPDVDTVTGDRTRPDDLRKLAGRTWDAVFDPSGYVPRVVGLSGMALRDSVDLYVFVSSISVYRDHAAPQMDESYPVGTLADATTEDVTGETYGPLKALCEETVSGIFGERALHVRAGLIVGPYDPTDRFTYWPVRIRQGGAFLAPVGHDQPMQFIDARDITDWALGMMARREGGVYNVTGETMRMGDVFRRVAALTDSDAEPVYVDAGFLAEHEVQPWQDLPLWLPASDAHFRHMSETSVARARANGLTFRPLETTVRDLLGWYDARDVQSPLACGLPAEKERRVLEAWRLR